ncbi:MAG: CvpA family protein [Clostridia bacterium]|nr:CvpA family protein [Clostridia bacterium]
MNPELLNLLLFAPFLLVVLITGLIFCIKGYKQGLWRALISLGITVVATVLSLLLSRLLAGILSGPILGMIPEIDLGDMAAFNDFAQSFVQGLVQEVLAILLFGIILFICLVVLKIVGNHVKRDFLKTESKGMKWGGFGVRVLDTVVVTILLLLPLYGTLATYVTPAAKVSEMAWGADSTAVKLLSQVANNPIVSLYKAGPAAWVQGGLSGFKVGNATVDLANIADLTDEALEKVDRLINAEEGEEVIAATADLSEFLRENLIEEEWFYSLVCEFKDQLSVELNAVEDEETKEMIQKFLDISDMSQEDFENNGIAVLDFVTYSLENGVVDFAQSGDYSDLPEDFSARLGGLMNHSKQAVALKKLILVSMAEQLYYEHDAIYDLLPDDYTDEQWEAAYNSVSKEAKRKAEALINAHFGTGTVSDPAQQVKEGEAFMILFFDSSELNMLEGLVRHPLFTYEDVKPLMTVDMILEEAYGYSDSELRAILESNPDLLNPLYEKLKSYETAPATDTRFEDYVTIALNMAAMNNGALGDVGYLSAEEIKFVIQYYGEDSFVPANSSVAAEAKDLIRSCLTELEKDPSAKVSFSGLIALMERAKEPSLWPDQALEMPSYNVDFEMGEDGSIHASSSALPSENENDEDGSAEDMEVYAAFYWDAQTALYEDLLCSVLSDMVSSKGADPYGLGRNLSAEQKTCFVETLDAVISDVGGIKINGGTISSGMFGNSASSGVVVEGGMQMVIISGNTGGADSENAEQMQAERKAQLEKNAAALKAFFGIDG